ncbi:hypothetical protein MMC25_004069 [Agyrium rufum]|nr:hypothetical protein [Agyrium rufum]
MASKARAQPPWQAPSPPTDDVDLPPIKIENSLTRSKTLFIPIDWKNRTVSWYACGPTVYDDAHLGHARNYVTTDIIRRILKDYFKYNVEFVMNITDVDDKIILRGRQQHFLANYIAKHPTVYSEELDLASKALDGYLKKNLPLTTTGGKSVDNALDVPVKYKVVLDGGSLDGSPVGDKEAKIKMHIKTALVAAEAIRSEESGSEKKGQDAPSFYLKAQDVLLPYLDSLYSSSIDASDHSIFTKLTTKYEDRFMEDVRALNCLVPDIVTRVTEYGQNIVEFVEKIQKNGFAYPTSDGSVYFDIEAFESAQNHYARLEPWNRNDTELQADGEGALSKKTIEKKSDADFALWKSSKPGEPSWPSPWGNGRPGWHIECSAMASDKLGSKIDIHSGGIDLAFPHHDNELAQSEAYWIGEEHKHDHQWVNYFMHMGHLSIQGSKMSKSLKNFTTIREALSRGDWTPRSLRIVFLLGSWDKGIEITDELVKASTAWEDKVNNFFVNALDILDNQSTDTTNGSESHSTDPVQSALEQAKDTVYSALCDSFNTSLAMGTISEFISSYNGSERGTVPIATTEAAAQWVTSLVNMFGLNGTAPPDSVKIGWSGIAVPEAAKSILTPLATYRDKLRRKARSASGLKEEDLTPPPELKTSLEQPVEPYTSIAVGFSDKVSSHSNSKTISKDILSLCDQLRDIDLWNAGIYLEDREGDQPALVRTVTKELRAAREEKEERDRQKLKAKEDREREAKEKAEKGRLSHLDMFRTQEYTAWDDEGLPLKDAKGEEINKTRTKKLKKDWERQKKSHEAWSKVNSSGDKGAT